MKNEEYKKLSIDEFTKAAERYESNHAGIYEMCKKDYPEILEELSRTALYGSRFNTSNDCTGTKEKHSKCNVCCKGL